MYLFSRLQAAINRVVVPLLNLPTPFSFVGPDSSLTLCRFIARSGARRIMLVTDGPLFQLGLVNPIVAELEALGVTVEVYKDVKPDPTHDQILVGIEHLRQCRADTCLAVGGGSSIDFAKTMLFCHANDCHPSKLIGLWLYALPRKPCMPFFVVPTTAGTGSEVTITAVVTDPVKHAKQPIIDPKLVPMMMALDPKLTTGLPPFITAPTGMDALTHAVESYICTLATPRSREQGLIATSIICRNLLRVHADGSDLRAREDMLVASSLAGLAFTRVGLGYVHAFAHQMGGLYHVPHGLANAIIMPWVLDFSKSHCAERLAELGRAAGLPEAGRSDAQLADDFIAMIRKMNQDMDIPSGIKDLRREDFERIIDKAFGEAHGTYGLPRYMSRDDARALLNRLIIS